MDISTIRSFPTNQATWAALVFRIIFNDATVEKNIADLSEGNIFRRHFLMGVRCNTNCLDPGLSAQSYSNRSIVH